MTSSPIPARTTIRNAPQPRTPCWPTRSRRWWRPAPSAWGSTSRIWASSCTSGPRRPPSPTTSRSAEAGRPLSTAALETRVDLSRGRLETMLKVLDTDGAVRRVSGGWAATGADWAYDAGRYARVAAERAREQQAMLGYEATSGCRMEYLRRELDDPAAAPCGRCDNCTGRHWPQQVPQAAVAAADDRLLRPGVEITPRRMWPAGMQALGIGVSGKIAPEMSAEPGRALGRLTDLGWGPRLRALLADGGPGAPGPGGPVPGGPVPGGPGPDGPVPDDLVAAVVRVLAAWDWAQRPAGVVTLPSRSRPRLIGSVAARIAENCRIPHLGE